METIRIKQVPNNSPNADGEWIERQVEGHKFFERKYITRPTLWDKLTTLCDKDHHAVAIERK